MTRTDKHSRSLQFCLNMKEKKITAEAAMKFTQRWRCSNQHALLHSKNAFLCWTISSFYFLFFSYSYLFSFGCCIYLASVCSVSGGCMSSSIRMWDTSLSQCLCSRVSWHRWQRVGKTAWAWAFKFTYQQIRLRKHNPLNALFFFLHVSSIFLCLLVLKTERWCRTELWELFAYVVIIASSHGQGHHRRKDGPHFRG